MRRCNVESVGTGNDSLNRRWKNTSLPIDPGCDHGSERAPHQAPSRLTARSVLGPREPGADASLQRGEAGQPAMRGQGHTHPTELLRAWHNLSRPTLRRILVKADRHSRRSQHPPAPAHAPGGHAVNDRRWRKADAAPTGVAQGLRPASDTRGYLFAPGGPDPLVGNPPGPLPGPGGLQVQRPQGGAAMKPPTSSPG